ncbi:MAG: HlyC/CorC family transporter [Clostridia bacterium]|nr:HlyC/CorC family transporter [Clostridia bacterium]
MESKDVITIFVMALLILMSSYFSATETAFSSLNKARLKALAEKGNKRAGRTLELSEKYDRLLSTILIGNNIVNIALTAIATVFFINILKSDVTGSTVATVAVTVLVLIFGEISPKTLAKESPERFAMFSTPLIRFFIFILTPFSFVFSLWQKFLLKIFKVKDDRKMTPDELLVLVDEVEEGGMIDADESELLRSAIEFNEQEAVDILTPRVDVEGVSEDSKKEDIARVFTDTGFSRLPVYRDSIDNIIGVVHQKDFYDGPKITAKSLREIMKPPVFVTPTMKISDILKMLQQQKAHIAVVTDEFGGTLGIVTMEDILEELVGEIWDEHDEVIEEFTKLDDGSFRINCNADLDEMFEYFDLDAEEDSGSVGGWVLDQIGKIPDVGDSFDYGNLHVTVAETDNQRVVAINVTVSPEEDEEEEKNEQEEPVEKTEE